MNDADPDLLDLDDLPDTSRIGVADPLFARALKALHGLSRWAKRVTNERNDEAEARQKESAETKAAIRGVGRSVIGGSGAVIVGLVSAGWYAATLVAEVRAESRALRDDVAELRTAIERVEERQWTGRRDATTHASERSEP